MTIDQIIAFNVVLMAAILSPGPAFLLLIRTALAEGRRAGIATGVGLAAMASVWTLSALLGLDALFTLVPWLYTFVKFAGACYLLYLAYKTWRTARVPLQSDVRPARHAFREGVLVNALNPKSVMFAAAVLVVVFPAEISARRQGVRDDEPLRRRGDRLRRARHHPQHAGDQPALPQGQGDIRPHRRARSRRSRPAAAHLARRAMIRLQLRWMPHHRRSIARPVLPDPRSVTS